MSSGNLGWSSLAWSCSPRDSLICDSNKGYICILLCQVHMSTSVAHRSDWMGWVGSSVGFQPCAGMKITWPTHHCWAVFGATLPVNTSKAIYKKEPVTIWHKRLYNFIWNWLILWAPQSVKCIPQPPNPSNTQTCTYTYAHIFVETFFELGPGLKTEYLNVQILIVDPHYTQVLHQTSSKSLHNFLSYAGKILTNTELAYWLTSTITPPSCAPTGKARDEILNIFLEQNPLALCNICKIIAQKIWLLRTVFSLEVWLSVFWIHRFSFCTFATKMKSWKFAFKTGLSSLYMQYVQEVWTCVSKTVNGPLQSWQIFMLFCTWMRF